MPTLSEKLKSEDKVHAEFVKQKIFEAAALQDSDIEVFRLTKEKEKVFTFNGKKYEFNGTNPNLFPHYLTGNLPKARKGICLHHTGGSLLSDISALTSKRWDDINKKWIEVTVPFVIGISGKIYQLHELDTEYGWHLGSTICNHELHKQIFGIEIVNIGAIGPNAKNSFTCEELAEYWRGFKYYEAMSKEQYRSVTQIVNYLCEKYSIKKQILPKKMIPELMVDVNIENTKAAFDYKPAIPQEIERLTDEFGKVWNPAALRGFNGITSHANWKYNINAKWPKRDLPPSPGFRWESLLDKDYLVFPLQTDTTALENPLHYYEKVEQSNGGYYPTGLNQTLHGGVHLMGSVPNIRSDVRCMAPGYIVAARLNCGETWIDKSKNPFLYKFLKNFFSFVLVRHDIQPLKDTGENDGDSFPLYSLYMHLLPPRWGYKKGKFEPEPKFHPATDDDYLKINWIRKITQARYNGIVSLDPESPLSIGNFYWTAGEITNETKWGKSKVYQKNSPELFEINQKKGDKEIAFVKKAPEDMAQAFDAMLKGAVVTFNYPFIKVDKGELIGYLQKKDNESEGYLHWEVFAPIKDSKSGFTKLLELASGKEAQKAFPKFADNNNNFLEEEELKKLFNNLPEKNVMFEEYLKSIGMTEDNSEPFTALKDDILEKAIKYLSNSKNTLQGFLVAEYKKYVNQYYEKKETSGLIFNNGIYYMPVKIKIPESSLKEIKSEDYEITIKILPKDKEDFIELQKTTIAELKGNGKFFLIPVDTSKIKIGSTKCHIELTEDMDAPAAQLAMFKNAVKFRLRNILVEHENEWNDASLKTLLEMLFDRNYLVKNDAAESKDDVVNRFFENLKPMMWWGRKLKKDGDDYGEVPVLGAEQSLFKSMLPEDKKIHNLHPVTAAWLINILIKAGKIKIPGNQELYKDDKENDKVIYYSWILNAPVPVLNESLSIIVIGENYTRKSPAQIFVQQSGGKIKIADIAYNEDGIMKLSYTPDTWDDFEIKIEKGGVTTPASAVKKITIAKPEIDYSNSTFDNVDKDGFFIIKLKFKAQCPVYLKGAVFFEYKKTKDANWSGLDKSIPVMAEKNKEDFLIYKINGNHAFADIKDKIKDSMADGDVVEIRCLFYSPAEPMEYNDENGMNQELIDFPISNIQADDETRYLVFPEPEKKEDTEQARYIQLAKKFMQAQFIKPIDFTVSGENLHVKINYPEVIVIANPTIECAGSGYKPPKAGKNSMTGILPLRGNLGKKIKFKAKLSEPAKIDYAVNNVEENYDMEIKLEDFDINPVKDGKNWKFNFTGKARNIPTGLKYYLRLKYKADSDFTLFDDFIFWDNDKTNSSRIVIPQALLAYIKSGDEAGKEIALTWLREHPQNGNKILEQPVAAIESKLFRFSYINFILKRM